MGNLTNSQEDFVNAWQRLLHRWQETAPLWDDSVCRLFEKQFWNPLEIEVASTRRELERLGEVIVLIKKENERR